MMISQPSFRAKVKGAWLLHQAFQSAPLDFFVLFSSAAAVLSSPRLGAYAAANSFLDSLAAYRGSLGLPALSVDWGVWSETGMATHSDSSEVHALSARGMGGIKTADGLDCLARLLLGNIFQACVMPVDWRKWAEAYPAYMAAPFLSRLAGASSVPIRGDVGNLTFLAEEAQNASATDGSGKVIAYLASSLERILGFTSTTVDIATPITDYGVDSLMALELKSRIGSDLGVSVPMLRLLQGPSLEDLATDIVQGLPAVSAPPTLSGPVSTTSEFPLSLGQQALWFIHQLTPDAASYNICFTARALPGLNLRVLSRSFAEIVARHSALRTTFVVTSDGQLVQRVHSAVQPEIRVVDAATWKDSELREEVIRDYQRPFTLDRPAVRVSVFRQPSGDLLLITVHHLLFDAWSMKILFEDLRMYYAAALSGSDARMAPLEATYRDFVESQSAMIGRPEAETMWEHWQGVLSGQLPILRISQPRNGVRKPTGRGGSIPLHFESSLRVPAQALIREQKTTGFVLLLATFQVLLRQYTGQDDIIVGSPSSGRDQPRWANVIGYFVNMLPFRADFTVSRSFREHLVRTREAVLGALANQEFPFPLMVERLRLGSDRSKSPVIQAFFNYLTVRSGDLGRLYLGDAGCAVDFGSSTLEPYNIPQQEGQFDIALEIVDADGAFAGTLKYDSEVIERAKAEDMAADYCRILDAFVSEPDAPVDELSHSASSDPGREDLVL